jgi:hypothetical protein
MRTYSVRFPLYFLPLIELARVSKVAFSRCLVVKLEGSAVAGAANSAGLAAATFWAGAVTLRQLGQANEELKYDRCKDKGQKRTGTGSMDSL